ncbi:MAG: LysM peptidoglycan-binding domain-containing protein [Chitinophagales bacterium]
MKKTLFFLTLIGTVSLYANPSGQFINHTVEKGQTLYSISKKYGLKPDEVARFNEAIGSDFKISVGQQIRIPASAAITQESESPSGVPTAHAKTSGEVKSLSVNPPSEIITEEKTTHVVTKGETVFSIARAHGITQEDLMAWNNLSDLKIRVGQHLKVSATTVTPISDPEAVMASGKAVHLPEGALFGNTDESVIKVKSYTWTMADEGAAAPAAASSKGLTSTSRVVAPSKANPTGKEIKEWHVESVNERMQLNAQEKPQEPDNDYEKIFYQYMYSGMKKMVESGMAKTIPATMNLAYYDKAEVGTILKLTNPQNSKIAYALVVGKLNEANGAVAIKVSNSIARQLNTNDLATVEIASYAEN